MGTLSTPTCALLATYRHIEGPSLTAVTAPPRIQPRPLGQHKENDLAIAWTEAMDRQLYRLVEDTPDLKWSERAAQLSADLGLPITKDMARNRYNRIVEQLETDAIAPPQNVQPQEIPAAQVGEYVGFRIAFWDLETSGLSAWNNEITMVSIADVFGNVVSKTRFEFEQSNLLDDKGLCIWLRDTLEQDYDILTAWNMMLFDLPFLNARLAFHGERTLNAKMGFDMMYQARGGRYGLKVGSSKLKNVAKFFRTPHQKPDLEWETFRLASMGDEDALEILIDRCEADCLVMRDIFLHLRPVIRTIHR